MSDKDKNKENTNKKGETSKPWTRGGKGKQYAPQVRKQPGEIPMLKFGTGNNFHVFKEAISKGGVKDFGHLGTLFETGKLYEPKMPTEAEYASLPTAKVQNLMYTEAIKGYMKQVNDITMNSPKLFGYIWQYLSPESIDEVKHQADYINFNKNKDPVKLWETIVKTHEINSMSRIPEVVKRATRKEYNACRQGGYESIITYRERFDAATKAYTDQGNPPMKEADIAMDFFDGLDPARYAQFKTDIHNGLTAGSITAAGTLSTMNKVYELAGSWIKTNVVQKQGVAATYVTTHLDKVQPKPKPKPTTTETPKPEEEKKQPGSKKKVKCYKCHEEGHYANKCPEKKKPDEETPIDANDEIHTLNATWEAATFCTHQVNSAMDANLKVQPNEIIIDNAADISIIQPHLLENVQQRERSVKINGVGGLTLEVNQTGYLPNFFEVYSSDKTLANVLSFSDVEDKYPITYIPGESFIVHLPDRDIEFKRRGKLYVALWEEITAVMTTVQEAEGVYTKAEVKRAKEAYDLLKNTGYPSVEELIHLIEDGNILELPHISRADIKRAYDLYGMPVEYVRGKMTKKRATRVRFEPALQENEKDQVLWSDVMTIDQNKFLITVCDPLNLTLKTHIERETADVLGLALQGHLQVLRERSFTPRMVHVDPASAFRTIRTQFPGTYIDVGGAKDFVEKVDAKIRRIKDTYRSVKAGLSWSLPNSRVKDLVAYCVSRLNNRRTSALNSKLSPRVLFTGTKPNYKKEFSLSFGDYVELYNGTTNTSAERSVGGIALYPLGNSTGSWQFWCFASKSYVRRSTWTKMVTTDVIQRTMSALALEDPVQFLNPASPVGAADTVAEAEIAEADDAENENVPDLVDHDDADSDSEDEDDEEESATGDAVPSRQSARIAAGIRPPERLTLATKIDRAMALATKVREDANEGTVNAVRVELIQLFSEMEALLPVKSVTTSAEILNAIMIVVEKFLASGEHDKWKGRLVADGRSQDRDLYPDKASPTLAIHSLFTVLAFYAGLIGYLMSKVDIKGAFVQTPMTGPPVYLRLNKKIASQVVQIYPEYKDFLQPDGSMLTQMLKAMYGCVQASSLWFALLTKVLLAHGYIASPTDRCVMRRESGGMIFCIMIYVDDLLIFASKAETERIRKFLTEAFTTITMTVDNTISYLGMQLLWKDRFFIVDMDFYVRQLLKDWMHLPVKANPGTRNLFKIDEKSELLAVKPRELFHSTVARILYLAKRVRADIITVVSFLCTRVTKATEEDQAKLESLLGYLKRTMTRKLYLHAMTSRQLLAFIDAAFALHFFDSKSHTGVIITMGGVVIYISSRKQKCIAKSPTEAELVGLTDNLGLVELFHEFLSFLFGKPIPTPIIYQDSTSVISLVTRGGGITRTKHMRARVNLGKECFDEKRAIVTYLNTKEMWADGASKILEGKPFLQFADFVTGIKKPLTTGGR